MDVLAMKGRDLYYREKSEKSKSQKGGFSQRTHLHVVAISGLVFRVGNTLALYDVH